MEGSSSTNRVLTSEVPSAVVRLMRCTSPPESVRDWRSSVEVGEAHLAQVGKPRADFGEQQVRGLVQRCGKVQGLEETAAALDRQQHQVVHGETGQRGELVLAPCDA